jgi:hypothetical protein
VSSKSNGKGACRGDDKERREKHRGKEEKPIVEEQRE